MKGTKATFPKRPRTHEGMMLGTITRHDATCEGETTARERKRTNLRNRRKNNARWLGLLSVGRARVVKAHERGKEEREWGRCILSTITLYNKDNGQKVMWG